MQTRTLAVGLIAFVLGVGTVLVYQRATAPGPPPWPPIAQYSEEGGSVRAKYVNLARIAVPGGWIVATGRDQLFVSDPNYRWGAPDPRKQ